VTGDYLLTAYEAGKREFAGAYLHGANLRSASLSGAYLRGANLRSASLSGADLRGATLSGADLSGADLRGANLSDADLSGANLSEALGIVWAAVSWTGHGACGRQLLAVADQDGSGIDIYHCSCFRGTRDALLSYIAAGEEQYKRSRRMAVEIVDMLLADGRASGRVER
jgi:hypothetical protein